MTFHPSWPLRGFLPLACLTSWFLLLASRSLGAGLPGAVTAPATAVTVSTAILNGTFDANGSLTTIGFDIGETTNYLQHFVIGTLAADSAGGALRSATASGLSSGQGFHYRAFASNSFGVTLGEDVTFTTLPGPAPTVTTLAAENVTYGGARLAGEVNPNGGATTVFVQLGTTIDYGVELCTGTVGNGSSPARFECTARSLRPLTLYHYRVVAYNNTGTNVGADVTFNTADSPPPGVATLPADQITATSARLNGQATPSGADSTGYFEFGATTNYGSQTSFARLGDGTGSVGFSIEVALPAGQTIHHRAVAFNRSGTNYGADLTATTLPAPPPTATTLAADGITADSARLNGQVKPNGAETTAYFQYGKTTNYDSVTGSAAVGAGTATTSLSSVVSLTAGTTYHFRVVASSGGGTTYGADLSFTTGAAVPPTVITLAADEVGSTSARLNGQANPNGSATTVYFEYGTDLTYGQRTGSAAVGETGVPRPFSGVVTLTPEATWHFRAVAYNSAGTNFGGDLTLVTGPFLPVITAARPLGSGTNTLVEFTGQTNTSYTVQASADLRTWTDLPAPREVSPGRYRHLEPTPERGPGTTLRVYRILKNP